MKKNLFEEVHRKVLAQKANGHPIKVTLKGLGISKPAYYRHLKKSGKDKWTQIKHMEVTARVLANQSLKKETQTKSKKSQKKSILKMSGGSLKTGNLESPNKTDGDSSKRIAFEIDQGIKRMQPFYDEFINGGSW